VHKTGTQKITTPSGETLIVLPLAEYQALIEAADIAAHKREIARLGSGQSVKLGAKDTEVLLAAPSPLSFWRKRSGMTQVDVAQTAGISQSYLSELESGARKGDPLLFKKLAAVLGVPLDDLIAD
jgi:DNA-binding XRE family transcriptional regulator